MIALVLALALQSSAAAAAPAPSTLAVAKKADDDKVECREQMMTGSHFSSRTCMRHSEWMRMHDESVDAMNRRGRDSNPPTFGHR